jgi:uncharacterized FAD-dependent dehydrogenase
MIFCNGEMMKILRLAGIKLTLDESEELLAAKVADALAVSSENIDSVEVIRKAIDARRSKPPHFVYVVEVRVSAIVNPPAKFKDGITLQEEKDEPQAPQLLPSRLPKLPVVVIGSGPSGIFAALVLAQSKIPVILLERGAPVETRVKDVQAFWEEGALNPHSNVLFGEGGAGTFSDGKLTSRTKNHYSSWIKQVLVEMGAPESILTEAKPHIGTDRLRNVIVNLRKKLSEMSCEIRFSAQVTDFVITQGAISALIVNKKDEIKTDQVILAIGQSADDTYLRLFERGIKMEAKPFAIGLRVEHPQELINSLQYGQWSNHPQLPPAEYFITTAPPGLNRSVYTFCMCPGGEVIGCGNFPGIVVANGMSNSKRNGEFGNSAVVVNVRADDFVENGDPLSGLDFRRRWEHQSFLLGGSNYSAPAQKLIDFLQNKQSSVIARTSFRPAVKPSSLAEALPEFITNALKLGIAQFDQKMPGFITEDAHLIGVETRTSSPVRICRKADGQSESIKGIYPCGEGAGYAGGIISSALDGVKAAQNLITNLVS